jgi:hypothetical protein
MGRMTSSDFRCRAVRLAFFSTLIVLFTAVPAFAQLRIVDYNTAGGPRNGMDEIIAGIEAESINGIARKPDMILLQEQDSVSTTTQDILEVLDSLYGVGVYQRSTVNGGSQGAGRPTMIFNTQTLQKIGAEVLVGTVGDSANARQGMRYRMRPVGTGYTSAADFYVFVNHYKAGSSFGGPTADQERRLAEAKSVRTSSDALGEVHAIYAGDFNMQSASEDAYEWLLIRSAWEVPGTTPIRSSTERPTRRAQPASRPGSSSKASLSMGASSRVGWTIASIFSW